MFPKFIFQFPTFDYHLTATKIEEHKSGITLIWTHMYKFPTVIICICCVFFFLSFLVSVDI